MARHKLTDTKVKSAKPGWHGDGDGLWLRVSPASTRSWVFVSIRHGRRREMGLGSYGSGAREVSLAAARDKAEQVRAILGRDGDPFTELPERQARVRHKTFGECADDLLVSQKNTFRNAKHAAQWKMTLTEYAKPLRKIPVVEVTADDVLRVLRPMWHEKYSTASRLRGRIEKVFDYAKALGLRSGENPARWKGHLDHILGKAPKLQRGHHAALAYSEVPAFMARLVDIDGLSERALELCILTATRSGEVLNAKWAEFETEKALWTIPADRMKAGKEHIVPLSAPALAVLQGLHAKRLSEFVFPGRTSRKPVNETVMFRVLQRMGSGEITVHGFRSAFRDWCGDATNFPRDVAEMALAHKVGDSTEQAYRRASALAKRRKLMDAWAAYISSIKGSDNVVAIRRP